MKKHLYMLILILTILRPAYVSAENVSENIYFKSETCLDCISIEKEIDEISKNINLTIYEIDDEGILDKLKQTYKYNNIDSKVKIPTLIIDGNFYIGKEEILNYYNKNYSSGNIFKVSLLGFIDGFNPCAISILLIFSSFLILTDKKKKLLLIGFSYILGSSITNLVLGLGILKLTSIIKDYTNFIQIIYIITLVICAYVIIINFVDIFNGLRNNDKIKNQLNINIKYKINAVITKGLNSKFLIFISFFLGAIIAILEFGCTGQVYLPTLLYMDTLNISKIFLLIIYNLMFALPLVIFLLLSIIFKPEQIRKKLMKKSYYIKIVVNIVLIILFIYITGKALA